jgi:hypothetical protein
VLQIMKTTASKVSPQQQATGDIADFEDDDWSFAGPSWMPRADRMNWSIFLFSSQFHLISGPN